MKHRTLSLLLLAGGLDGGDALAQSGPASPARTPTAAAAAAVPQAAGRIRGVVARAADGAPVAGASVEVRAGADSALVAGAVTGADGAFRVQGLAAGTYRLRFTHPSHAPRTRDGVALSAGAPESHVGTVRLDAAATVLLEGLAVTAERGGVGITADRNTYTARDLPSAAGGSVADVLRNVPAVDVDADGRVSLRGNDNVAVQINGRAAPVRGDQLAAFLQQLPATLVERVEVVPSPSARYDPEGMAGIVNVVLRSTTDLGLSGGLSAAAGSGGRYNGTGNLGYQRGPWTLFGSLGWMDEARESTGLSTRENLGAGAPVRRIGQTSDGASWMRSRTLNTTAELRLGAASSLAATLLVSGREYRNGTRGERLALDAAGASVSAWDDRLTNDSEDDVLDGTLSWKRVAEPGRDEATVEVRYNRLDVAMRHGLALTPRDAAGEPSPGDTERTRRRVGGLNDDLSLQADLVRAVAGVRVETGVRAGRRRVDNDTRAERTASGSWQPDPGASSVFGTEETTAAAYGVLSRTAGPWEAQGGLRVERTGRSFVGTGDAPVSAVDLFPSALLAYNLGTTRQVKAAYARRIGRPQTFMLNSIAFYEDPLNRSRGNPALRPEFTDAVELGFQQSGAWGSLQVGPFLRRTTGAIRVVRALQGDTTTGVFTNLDRALSYGADANASLRGARWSALLGANAFAHETRGGADAGGVRGSGVGWSVRGSGTLRLGAGTELQGAAQYRAPMTVQQGRVGAFASTSLSLRQRLRGDRATLTLRLNDLFDTMRTRRTTDASDEAAPYVMESERGAPPRALTLGLQYGFGKAPKLRAPRPQEPGAGGDTGS